MPYQETKLGGWRSQDFGLQPGRNVETRVSEITTDKGAKFKQFCILKPYQVKENSSLSTLRDQQTGRLRYPVGSWMPGYKFPLKFEVVQEIVQRLNHLCQNFLGVQGEFVFTGITQQQQTPAQIAYPQTAPVQQTSVAPQQEWWQQAPQSKPNPNWGLD